MAGAADELRKVIDVGQPQLIRNIFRIRRNLPYGRHVLGPKAVRDSHLVLVGVPDEREQTAVLVFPGEAAEAGLARRLQDGNIDGFAMNPASALLGLPGRNGEQRTVVYRFDVSVSERVQRSAQGPDAFAHRNVLLRFGQNRPIVDDRTAGNAGRAVVDEHRGIHEVAVGVEMPDPQLGKLAGAAGDGVLMAFGACAAVEHRTQSAVHVVLRFIDLLVQRKTVAGWLGNSVALALGAGILYERGSIKARR